MTWLIVIVIAAVVMGAIGYFSSKDGKEVRTRQPVRWPERWAAAM